MSTLAFHPYSISGGGLFARLDPWLRLPPDAAWAWRRRVLLYIAITYLPLLLVGIVMRVKSGAWEPVMLQLETHARSLLAGPLFLLAEHVVDARARDAGEYLLKAEIVQGEEVNKYARVIERTEYVRDSVTADSLLFSLALASQLVGFSTLLETGENTHFLGGIIALTMYRFLLLRWLWRWTLWTVFLLQIARMRLSLSAIHPDRAGGLLELAGPSESFAIVAATGSVTLAGAWFDRMRGGVPLSHFYGPAAAYVIIAVGLAILPILVFTGKLYQIRRANRLAYGAFARRYCDAFERKWLGRTGQEALGSADLQSLADLGGSYEVSASMRIVVCDARLVVTLIAACVVPLLPLGLMEISATEFLLRLVKALA